MSVLNNHPVGQRAEQFSVLVGESLILVDEIAHQDVPVLISSLLGKGLLECRGGLRWHPRQPVSFIAGLLYHTF